MTAVLQPPIPARPRTRGECRGTERPCAYVACRHHLALEVIPASSLRRNAETLSLTGGRATLPGGRRLVAGEFERFSDDTTELLDELDHTCSLDVAEQVGELAEDDLAAEMRVTRGQARRQTISALAAYRAAGGTSDGIRALQIAWWR